MFPLDDGMALNLRVNLKNIAVWICILIFADGQRLRRCPLLFDFNPPNGGICFRVANTDYGSVNKSDSHITVIASDFVLFVFAALNLAEVITCAVNFCHTHFLHLYTFPCHFAWFSHPFGPSMFRAPKWAVTSTKSVSR